jgi:hypothetical protein
MLCKVRSVQGSQDTGTSQGHSHASEIKHHKQQRSCNLTVQVLCALNCKHQNYLQSMKTDPRTAYELFLRKRVSDNHWQSVKRALSEAGMDINDDTVVFYGKLRKLIPRGTGNVLQVFECYQKAEKLLALNNSKVTGTQVLELLNQEGINPHPATISRWFKALGGFRKTRFYYPEKLVSVLTSAFIYKLINSPKLGA